MNWYERYLLPWFLHLACSSPAIRRQRSLIVPQATGDVLEIGMGTGLNLPHYRSDQVSRVVGLEPSAAMRKRAQRVAQRAAYPIEIVDGIAEEIPKSDQKYDCIVLTYTLCTIPNPNQGNSSKWNSYLQLPCRPNPNYRYKSNCWNSYQYLSRANLLHGEPSTYFRLNPESALGNLSQKNLRLNPKPLPE